MKYTIHDHYKKYQDTIIELIINFLNEGKVFVIGKRNIIKLFEINGEIINVKSFKKPNFINKIVYRYFRKSKAERSYSFAMRLKEMQIGTPQPIAFFENYSFIGLKESYYICEHINDVVEFREIIHNEFFENRESIIRAFTRFTFELHEKGVEFLDHSPGNTLVKQTQENNYSFYLVDLNRMRFHQNNFDFFRRMKNLSKMTNSKEIVQIMSNEYAMLCGEDENKIFNTLWKLTCAFQFQFHRKKRLKKKLRFWKQK